MSVFKTLEVISVDHKMDFPINVMDSMVLEFALNEYLDRRDGVDNPELINSAESIKNRLKALIDKQFE